MNKNLKIILYGFLVWLVPFAVSFIIFPLRASMRPLFESIMPLVLTIIVVILAYYYLKDLETNLVKEGVLIGLSWLAINLIIDLMLFLPASPMHMNILDYFMDIGLTYIIIPVITVGMGIMANNKSECNSEHNSS
jgi:hypothetical protein